ncbi:MAG TPA: PAS domain S-box protein, partial [Candidatus Kryptonia bacterium]|nr:PAS domain S-box protein [Candidatus Kryptonia bacterium]
MMSPPAQRRDAFQKERQAQLVEQAPAALLIAAALIAAYNLLTACLGSRPPPVQALLVLIEVLVPLFGAALVRNPPARLHVELTLLLLDMLFTTVAVSEILLPSADAPGIAIALGLKTVTTALVFPWAPRWQAAAASYTLFAFTIALRSAGTAVSPHAVVALTIGALVSVIGSVIVDRHRRALHLKQVESAESEEKYRSLTEGAVAGVFVYQDEQFRFVNDACARMLGYRRDELVGRSNRHLHRPEDLVVVRRMVDEIESGARSSFESVLRAYRRDGSEMSGRASYSRILYEGRAAVLGVVIDVTAERAQQRKAEQLTAEVLASEARYRDLFENATDLIIETDLQGNFVDANPAALSIAGYQRDDLARGLRLVDLLPSDYLPVAAKFRTDLLAGRAVQQPHTAPLIAADGSRHAIELHTRLIHHPGKPPVFQSIGRDVTERQAHLVETQRMVAFQRALTAVAPTLHAPHGLDEVFALIAEVCRQLFDVTTVRLWTIEGDAFVGRGASGALADQVPSWRWSVNESALPSLAVRERRPIYVNHLAESQWRTHPVVASGAQSWMAIPLLSGDSAIGVLALQDHADTDRFSEQSIEWGLIFASQAVLAIENARLRDRERAEARTTTLLLQFAQTLHARLGDADTHTVLAREAARILECDIGSIVLWQSERGRFRVAHVTGVPDEWRAEIEGLEFEPQTPTVFTATALQFGRQDAATSMVALLMERWSVEQVLYLPIRRDDAFLAMLVL